MNSMTSLPRRRTTRSAPRLLLAAVLAVGSSACGEDVPPLAGCTLTAKAGLPRALRETSGAAWSRRAPGAWWSLNDSGNEPVLFLLDSAGRRLTSVRVRGAENRDWEDMAAGPCAGGAGDCLYAADVGDNDAVREHVTVYRVPEPAAGDTGTAPAERFRGRYPDGPADAEAFFVLPDGGAYVVTKGSPGPIALYRFPLDTAGVATLERVRVLDAAARRTSPGHVTGAGASPDGRWVALRTYSGLALYRREALLGSGAPAVRTSVESLGETQGEAVAVDDRGRVLLTSERRDGKGPGLRLLSCPLP